MKKAIFALVPLAILAVIFGTIYVVVQQAQRSGANYPQIQIAEDTAAALDQGNEPYGVITSGKVDLSKSLAPFTIIYDKTGHVVAGSGFLNNKIPSIPVGVLTAAKNQQYNAVTWQPQKDVRIASVAVSAKDYYVVSGRSLYEVEKQESLTLRLAALGLLVSLVVLGVGYICSLGRKS